MPRASFLLLAIVGVGTTASSVTAEDAPDGKPLAWMRFEKRSESYAGKPYLWLGRAGIDLTVDVKPAPGRVLLLLWGSKNDTRTATVTVNGKPQKVEAGGYDGFRWKKVPLPAEGKGESYRISIRRSEGKAAFLAEVRLVDPSGKASAADAAGSAAHKVTLKTVAATPLRAPAQALPPLPGDPLDRSAEIAGYTISKVQRWLREKALSKIEPDTGLYHPDGRFNYQDAWADCYPFLVWAAWLTDLEALNGPVRGALHAEIKHCPKGFFTKPENTYGGSEYVKDGLIAIVEVTGKDEWFDRMKAVQDEIWAKPTISTKHGKIPSTNIEINGEQIQALARMFTMTGEKRYLEYAERLADHYLLPGDFAPTRLRDHGCEIIGGLGLLLAVESVHNPEKAKQYLPHMKKMLDTVLAKGTNEDGIMYNRLGSRGGLSDGWGYNYVAYLCYDMVVGKPVYRRHMEQALRNLAKPRYRNYPWEGRSIDGYADSVEGGLYILNRLPVPEGLAWADHEVRANIVRSGEPLATARLWGTMKLESNGVRTAIMHALMHTRGTIARPWQRGLKLGAVDTDGGIEIVLKSDKPYEGRLVFDIPRHRRYMGFKRDWPRMNTVPEWFTVEPDETGYTVHDVIENTRRTMTGAQLRKGLPVKLSGNKPLRLKVVPGRAEGAEGARGPSGRHAPGEETKTIQYRKTNMHLCPEGKWAVGEDKWGKIVRVNMLKITPADWAKVPGVKKAWPMKGFEGVEGMAFHPVISEVKDVDADGKPDIFRCRSEHPGARIERLRYDDGSVVWESEPLGALHGDESRLPVFDLHGAGRFSVLHATKDGTWCIDADTGKTEWAARDGRGDIIVGHFLDKNTQAVVVRDGGVLHCYDHTGRKAWTHDTKLRGGAAYAHEMGRCDVDGDGLDEILPNWQKLTMGLRGDGTVLWEDRTQRHHSDFVDYGDVDGDGKIEVIYDHEGCDAAKGPIYVVEPLTGKIKSRIDYRKQGVRHAQNIALGNFDKSSRGLEIAFCEKGRNLYLFDAAGKLVWKRPVPVSLLSRGDWDGDGDEEILAFGLGANVDGMFSVWDGDGKRLYAISFLPSPYNRMLDKNVYKKNLGGTWRAHAMPGGHEGIRRQVDLDSNGRADVIMPFGEWHWGSDSILFLMEGRPKSD